MANVTVYLPDDLRAQAKEAGLSLSPLLQAAVRAALSQMPPTEQEQAQKREQAVQQLATTLDIPAEALDVAEDGLNHWATAITCRHPKKRPGASGLLKCVDCGEVLP